MCMCSCRDVLGEGFDGAWEGVVIAGRREGRGEVRTRGAELSG